MRLLALDTATEACSVALLTDGGLIGVFKEVGRGHAEEILGMVDAILAQGGLTLGQLDGIAASVGPGAFTGIRISVSVAQGLAFGAGLPVIGISTLEALALQAVRRAAGLGRSAPDGVGRAAGGVSGSGANGSVSGASSGGGASEDGVLACLDARMGAQSRVGVLACLDARMGEVYWGCFGADAERGVVARSPMAVGPAGSVQVPFVGPFQGIGRGFATYSELASLPGLDLPDGARNALPDAKDMARLGAIRLASGEGLDPADLSPRYLRDNVARTEVERAANRAIVPDPLG